MNELDFLFANTLPVGLIIGIFVVLVIWATVWKGFALWKAARLGAKWWFVALLIVNTAGILEILYLFVFSKRKSGIIEASAEAGVN